MFFVSVIEAVAVERRLQPRRRVAEKERVLDEIFLAEFGEEYLGNRFISRRKEPHVASGSSRATAAYS